MRVSAGAWLDPGRAAWPARPAAAGQQPAPTCGSWPWEALHACSQVLPPRISSRSLWRGAAPGAVSGTVQGAGLRAVALPPHAHLCSAPTPLASMSGCCSPRSPQGMLCVLRSAAASCADADGRGAGGPRSCNPGGCCQRNCSLPNSRSPGPPRPLRRPRRRAGADGRPPGSRQAGDRWRATAGVMVDCSLNRRGASRAPAVFGDESAVPAARNARGSRCGVTWPPPLRVHALEVAAPCAEGRQTSETSETSETTSTSRSTSR
jgi:hypothetical protein